MKKHFGIAALLTLATLAATRMPALGYSQDQTIDTGVTAHFRGLSTPADGVVWISGTGGTVVRTENGGSTWQTFTIAGAETLDLRDIEAFDTRTAYALSIGPGTDSRIFKTVDGGLTWETQFTNQEPEGFLDAMAFWDPDRGIAVSDSIDGAFYVLRTVDGGAHWTRVPPESLPAALPGEGYFAASGTNVITWGENHVWFGTGASARSRVARSEDAGLTWEVFETPIPAGPTAGIYSIAFHDADNGMIVGGDYSLADQADDNAAFTTDGGRTWHLSSAPALSGFRSAVRYVPGTAGDTLFAVGSSGADLSVNAGRTWQPHAAPRGLHTMSIAPDGTTAWAAGSSGLVKRFLLPVR